MTDTRDCAVCLETRPLDKQHYSPLRAGPDGFHTICRKCQGAASAAKQRGEYKQKEDWFRARNPEWNPAPRTKEARQASTALLNLYPDLTPTLQPPARNKARWAWVEAAADAIYDDRVSEPERARLVKHLDDLCRDTADPEGAFRVFFRTLRRLILDYVPLGPIHDDLISAMVNGSDRKLILASRASGKSTIINGYLAWRFLLEPLLTATVISKSAGHAARLLRSVRTYIQLNPLLRHLEPAEDGIDNASTVVLGPAQGKLGMSQSLLSVGLGGQITGTRAHLVVLDDVENANAHGTVESVDKLEETFREANYVLHPGGELIVLGTPQTPHSIYGRLARTGTWEVTKARMFEDHGEDQLVSRWPERWTDADLIRKRREVGPIGWSLHYDLNTNDDLAKIFPLKLRDLTVLNLDPRGVKAPLDVRSGPDGPVLEVTNAPAPAGDWWRGPEAVSDDTRPYLKTVAAVDPALGKQGGDAVGVTVVSVSASGQAFIRAVEAVRRDTPREAMLRAAEIVQSYQADTLVVESVGMQELYGEELQALLVARSHPVRLVPFKGGGQRKSVRIIGTLAPLFAGGRIIVCRAVLDGPDGHQFANEVTQVSAEKTHTRNDDLVDSLSMAFSEIADHLQADRPMALAGIRSKIDAHRGRGLRTGGTDHPLYEAMAEASEYELELAEQIAHFEHELRVSASQGIAEPNLTARLNQLKADLAKLQGAHAR